MDIKIRELESFCDRWFDKANSYPNDLTGNFDKFTSLYVAYNRVYTEVGKVLIAQGKVNPSSQGQYAPLPDRKSATFHIVDYYGESDLRNELANDPCCKQAVETLAKLILEKRFYLHVNYQTGNPDSARDTKLAKKAQKYQPKSVLELIYQARCNLFHGAKRFEDHQHRLLYNMSIIVKFVTQKALEKLKQDLYNQ